MAQSGFPLAFPPAGRLIATDTGCGSPLGAGLGLTMLLGVLLPSTTDAGSTTAALGAGLLARFTLAGVLTMRPLWSAGSVAEAGVSASPLALVADAAGSRSAGVNPTIPG